MEGRAFARIRRNVVRAVLAGLVASIVFVLVLWGVAAAGGPAVDAVALYGTPPGGLPEAERRGGDADWTVFAVGTFLWTGVYAALSPWVRISPILKGIAFGLLTYLYAFLVHVPLFASQPVPPPAGQAVLLAAHLAYGSVLGLAYRPIPRKAAREGEWEDPAVRQLEAARRMSEREAVGGGKPGSPR